MKQIINVVTLACVVALTACASGVQEPKSLLTEAELSLSQARSAEAMEYAPAEYESAEQHLTMAKQSLQEDEYKTATWALEKSIADSNYAIVKSNSAKSEMAAKQIAEDLRTLQRETAVQ